MNRIQFAGAAGLAFAATALPAQTLSPLRTGSVTAPVARILVGPDFRVNRESDAPHFETHVAADPTRPRNLIGASIAEPGGRSVAWRSGDGGMIWRHIAFPGEPLHQGMYSSGDPQVAFTDQGSALFVTMSRRPQAKRGRGIDVFRSPDGGATWDSASFIFGEFSVDHPQLTTGHLGRSYLTYMHGYPEYDIELVTSADDGRTWSASRRVVASPPTGGTINGVNTLNMLVLRDGTLFLPFTRFSFDSGGLRRFTSGAGAIVSHDGGETFGPQMDVFPSANVPAAQLQRFDFSLRGTSGQFAADTTSGPYADRLYVVTTRNENGRLRLLISSSSDVGQHWSAPHPVTADLPAGASQFQPTIAVNNRGAVGIVWFDTRRWPKRDKFDVFFSASIDGGETFLPAARISSMPSTPRGAGNFAPTVGSEGNEVLGQPAVISSMYSYRASGGDYIGLASAVDGVFHPFWPDSRSGTFHVWTARVEVTRESVVARAPSAADSIVSLKTKTALIVDPGWFDAFTAEMVLPVRIKNTSTDTLTGPIRVTVAKAWQGGPKPDPRGPPTPVFTNISRGGKNAAPYYDYSAILGPRGVLGPGEISGAVEWRVRFGKGVQEDFLRFTSEVTGVVMGSGAKR